MIKKILDFLFKKQQKSIPERIEETKELLKKPKKVYKDQVKGVHEDGLQRVSKNGLADLVHSEAITTKKYKDSAGVWTIGIGFTQAVVKGLNRRPAKHEMELDEIFTIYKRGIEVYADGVRKMLKVKVSQHMFDGLVSFAYNIGIGGARKSSLIRAINKGVTDEKTLKSLLMRWNKVRKNGKLVTSKGLINRRKKEAAVMFEARYSNKKMVGRVIPVGKNKPLRNSKKAYKIDLNEYL
jgi:lysozyme